MRPHRLTLKNVGPFVGETTINFDALDDIFLITGKTGSGKTTLFDALCFALYGVLPGGRRGLNQRLRSDFAEEDAECLVSLDFSLGTNRYRVDRSPKQERKKKRGSGTLIIDETAVLYEVTGGTYRSLGGKKSEVDEKLRSLIGLSEDEFSKIVLLPQGEFAEFLKQNTTQRREVLRKLFPVDLAVQIRDIAQARSRDLSARLMEAEQALQEAARRCPPDSVAERRAALEALLKTSQERVYRSNTRLEELNQALGTLQEERTARERLEGTIAKLQDLRSSAERIEQKEGALRSSRRARPLEGLLSQKNEADRAFQRAEEDLMKAKQEAEGATALLEELLAQQGEVEAWEHQRQELQGQRVSLQNALLLETELEKKQGERAVLEASEKSNAQLLLQVRNQSSSLRADIGGLEKIAAGAAELDRRWEEVRAALERAKRIRPLVEKVKELGQKKVETAEELEQIRAEREELERRCPALESELAELQQRKVLADQAQKAAQLAQTLAPGLPCPVCGSTDHPAPAGAPTPVFGLDERIDAVSRSKNEAEHRRTTLRAEETAQQKNLDRLEDELGDLIGQIGEIQSEVPGAFPKESPNPDSIRGEIEKLSREATELGNLRAAAVRSQDRLRELYRKREELSAQELGLTREATAVEEKKAALVRDIDEKLNQREQLLRPWKKPTIREALASVEERIEAFTEKIRTFEESRDRLVQQKTATSARYGSAAEKTAEYAAQRDRAHRALIEALHQGNFASVEELSAALLGKEEEEALEKEISDWKEAQSQLLSLKTEQQRALQELEHRREAQRIALGFSASPTVGGNEGGDYSKLLHGAMEDESERRAEAELERDRAITDLAALNQDRRIYEEAEKRRKTLSDEAAQILQLSNDLTGNNPKRRSFDAWLLALYLQEVASYATKRLERMSEGRYSLILDVEGEGNRGRAGLDLAVFDSHTGKNRPCATLSGGESFMASICLALGLADSIQSRSGGIRLDAVFIDEGFGSLDDGSLDRALTILDEIRDHRMVGLISHVGEMKSRIPSRIEILKTETGSSIRP